MTSLVAAFLLVVASACAATTGSGSHSPTSSGPLDVVAGENFWGSLAGQLGGAQVHVTSVVSDPNADPHEYETNPADARAFTAADLVILNGAGYDDWASKLLSAQPQTGRRLFSVATLLKKKPGDNPHFWYDPADVFRVIDALTAEYEWMRPHERSYFAARHAAVERTLDPYRAKLRVITTRFSGTPVASTEEIFQYLADYLHLDLVTPLAFMKAVAEGIDPPASSVATFDRQIEDGAFRVLVYNSQTVTPLTTVIKDQAAHRGVPVIAVSETIQPSTDSFETWMVGELDTLAHALTGTSAP
ncbi:MAG TPA: zinc ABC transporter substrate-binding protein [Acidimicrobiales bacterium]|nr:zinc ABC transporter substrate-binding protein [Acidimicrobiales bacterium]